MRADAADEARVEEERPGIVSYVYCAEVCNRVSDNEVRQSYGLFRDCGRRRGADVECVREGVEASHAFGGSYSKVESKWAPVDVGINIDLSVKTCCYLLASCLFGCQIFLFGMK